MNQPDLRVNLAGIAMKNPVTVASGTFGYGPEYADLIDLNRLGAIVVKGVSLNPCPGNPLPRIHETPAGMMNAIGLQNPGAKAFIKTYLPFLANYDLPVIVNIWGRTIEDYEGVAELFEGEPGVAGLELNVSCPNIKEGGNSFGTHPDLFEQVISAVRKKTTRPLLVKLSPNVPDITVFAKTAEQAGADGLSLINTLPAMAIDVETRRPRLANVVGGLSGPAIHPVAVKLVWEAARAVNIPIVGMGGILDPEDALEFIIAGASAVAVGTATFHEPTTVLRIIEGIEEYLLRHHLKSIAELRGTLKTGAR
ncbi:MAG: dihydroorotate dehydrogenase [Kiritimatiellae bacterium]|nr:dihydroorotate dehydrogenase [Kiritimatiellia bacterium]MDD4736050.1 dihydroorotate dehydrogenase [Kiritimatiellia bacterium]